MAKTTPKASREGKSKAKKARKSEGSTEPAPSASTSIPASPSGALSKKRKRHGDDEQESENPNARLDEHIAETKDNEGDEVDDEPKPKKKKNKNKKQKKAEADEATQGKKEDEEVVPVYPPKLPKPLIPAEELYTTNGATNTTKESDETASGNPEDGEEEDEKKKQKRERMKVKKEAKKEAKSQAKKAAREAKKTSVPEAAEDGGEPMPVGGPAESTTVANGTADNEGGEKSKSKSRFIAFVGNLPFSATKAHISTHFASLKPIDVRLLTERNNPSKSRGIAFVEFDNYDHMKTCLEKFHHSEFNDGISSARKINVELTAGGGGKTQGRQDKIKAKNVKLNEERVRRAQKEEIAKQERQKAAARKAKKEEGKEDSGVHPSRRARVPGQGKKW